MYSDSLNAMFTKSGISIGDRIKIQKKDQEFTGFLMPRAKESSVIVLKLDNGYNIGINSSDVKISLVEKNKPPKEVEDDSNEGEISILGCGGTICSKIDYKTGAAYPLIKAKELVASFPEIEKITSIKSKTVFQGFSEDMNQEHWKLMAKAAYEEIKDGSKGVVLMHGTDTIHYSSAALSFMLQDVSVPVIFVGAQRSSDRPSSDNRINLLNAIYSAKKNVAEVTLCMHAHSSDSFCYLHRGTKVRKMHTSRRDAFRSINSQPIAIVDHKNNRFETLVDFIKRDTKRKTKLDTKMSSNVALIHFYPGLKPKLIDSLRDYDGVLISSTGLGHVAVNPSKDSMALPVIDNLKSLIDSEIPVVFAPQTIYGRLNLNVYSSGRLLKDIGVIGDGCDWTPETAYVKLCYVLGHEKKMNKIRKLMMENMAGELTTRSDLGD